MSRTLLLVLAAFALAGPAAAEVVDSQPDGFTVMETAAIAASPAKVWATLIKPAAWWSPDHTYSHDARNLTLDPRAGGAWIETLPSGGGVRHMVVVYIDPPKALRLEGALGPLQAMGGGGHMTVTLKPKGEATDVTLTYDFSGHTPGGLLPPAPAVDGVLKAQITRLKAAVEQGSAP